VGLHGVRIVPEKSDAEPVEHQQVKVRTNKHDLRTVVREFTRSGLEINAALSQKVRQLRTILSGEPVGSSGLECQVSGIGFGSYNARYGLKWPRPLEDGTRVARLGEKGSPEAWSHEIGRTSEREKMMIEREREGEGEGGRVS
jgi:hypothetical protein